MSRKMVTLYLYVGKDGSIFDGVSHQTQKKDAAVCVLCAMYKFCNKRRTGKWQNRNYL